MSRDRPPTVEAAFEAGAPADRPASRAARWLRVLKLLLTVCLLAISVWQALGAL